MDMTFQDCDELRRMRDSVRRSVNSLELCWSCQRICECEQWLANESVPLWLCTECVFEAWHRLENLSMSPVSLSAAA
jgi:hypothetical protein